MRVLLLFLAIVLAGPAAAQQTIPVFGVDRAGGCRSVAVRDPQTGAMTSMGCLNGGYISQPSKLNVLPNPAAGAWVQSAFGGDFAYLPNNATAIAPQTGSGIGAFSSAHTAETTGQNAEVGIGQAALCAQDKSTGSAGAWCFYATGIRSVTSSGPLHGMEIDITNEGNSVPLFPATPDQPGFSNGIRIMAGGEHTQSTDSPSSAALVIGQNDPTGANKWNAGIVFGSRAIAGTDGAVGTGDAIRFGGGQAMTWYANTNAIMGGMVMSQVGLGGEMALTSYTSTGVLDTLAFNAFQDHSFAPQAAGLLDLGLAAHRWNGLYATRINTPLTTPASSSAVCTPGDQVADANYVYVCVATNTWKRAALSSW